MFELLSPNMLKTFDQCSKKFEFRYIKGISMPINDDIFESGKNIHALASYYLRGENINKMETSLNDRELEIWSYLKEHEYLNYEHIANEYNLSVKIGEQYFGGRLDAVVKKGDKYFILDYKTGSAPKNAIYDYQTMIYMLAASEFYKTSEITFVYIDLKHRTNFTIDLNETLKNEYKERLLNISNKIDKLTFSACSDCSNIDSSSKINCEYSIICYH